MSDWKAKLADLTKVEAAFLLVIFFTVLAIVDALIPQVDMFAAVLRWLEALVELAATLIRELRGAVQGS